MPITKILPAANGAGYEIHAATGFAKVLTVSTKAEAEMVAYGIENGTVVLAGPPVHRKARGAKAAKAKKNGRRGPGRPPGSRNRPKATDQGTTVVQTEEQQIAEALSL
jgi:hypothetical protein